MKHKQIKFMMRKKLNKDFRNFFKSRNPYQMTSFDSRLSMKPSSYMTPNIMKESDSYMTQLDVMSELMANRIIFFGDEVDSESCNIVVSQLLYLNKIDPDSDINMYINCPGGSIYDGNSVIDVMNAISNDVATTVTGLAASYGSILLVSGTRGKRAGLKHSKILLHQPMSGIQSGSQASDITILSNEVNELKKELQTIISDCTGKPYKDVEKDCDRDFWIKSEDALKYGKYGIIDRIIDKI